MYIKVSSTSNGSNGDVVIRCPHCGNGGTLDQISNVQDCQVPVHGGKTWFGQRICPNSECRGHIFFVRPHGENLFTYPSLRIEFDSDNLPDSIRETFGEAVTCAAEKCFVASAIMVRRTLEELCENKKASGGNLKAKIQSLQSSVVLPVELFNALDELRLLGNDAAHIESKDYDDIGEDEISIAIELTKEILKGVYQMDALVQKLKNLKKT